MNPFQQKFGYVAGGILNWSSVYPTPYSKITIDPCAKARIVLMSGIKVEAVLFKHQLHQSCPSNDLWHELALPHRAEQQ